MKNWLLVLVLPVILWGCVAGQTQGDGRPSVQTWEYLSVRINRDLTTELNKYSAEGWELVTVFIYGEAPNMIFKRPKK